MKHIEEYLKDVIKVEPLGKLTTKDDELNGMSGEMVYIDGKCSNIFISHADYVNWLEKQDEKNPVPKWKYKKDNTPLLRDSLILNKYGCVAKSPSGAIVSDVWVIDYDELAKLPKEDFEKQGEQVPTEKIEPKFHRGDWVILAVGELSTTLQIVKVDTNKKLYWFNDSSYLPIVHEECLYLWTIKDAKPGDVLYSKKHNLLWIYKNTEQCVSCINLNYSSNISIGSDIVIPNDTCPAAKEQRDLLFQKMKEAGYKLENNQLEEINNKGFVDLGLPSGTLWSKCNLGAEKETDLGLLFQWGDTKGYESVNEHQFSWEDYKFGSWDDLTKYNEKDTKLILENEDDPVFVATKGKFKTPTKEQLQELIDHTNHKWATIERVNGMKFWKKGTEEPTEGDSYIFIPAAGHCCNDYHYGVDSWGYVWSASRKVFDEGFAWTMKFFDRGGIDIYTNCYCNGFSVRGVVAPQAETFDDIDDTDDGQPVDLGLPSGTKWMKSNIGATKPSGFGKFFQWGNTQGYSGVDEHQFNWNDYKWGTFGNLTKYNNTDGLTLLEASDDSAAAATSGGASMPTKNQLKELIGNTEHRWLSLANGVKGMKFWKKSTEEPTDGNSYIFIPAAGYCYDGSHSGVGSWGGVWSASRLESFAYNAWHMDFHAGSVGMNDFDYRCVGYSVRGILREKC